MDKIFKNIKKKKLKDDDQFGLVFPCLASFRQLFDINLIFSDRQIVQSPQSNIASSIFNTRSIRSGPKCVLDILWRYLLGYDKCKY